MFGCRSHEPRGAGRKVLVLGRVKDCVAIARGALRGFSENRGRLLPALRAALLRLWRSGPRGLLQDLSQLGGERWDEIDAERYRQWLAKVETSIGRWLSHSESRREVVGFSVLLPVYNPNRAWLEEAIDSVVQQSHSRWELLIVDDGSTDRDHLQPLRARCLTESRIRLTELANNGGIASATNEAARQARERWLVFLDQDDRLHPACLSLLASWIGGHPEAELIYTDEDKLDAKGQRCAPHFKPDFNLDLLRGVNYFCHCVAIRADLFERLGGSRSVCDGAQDWDLILRAVSTLGIKGPEDRRIGHLPIPLYSWRNHRDSTASGVTAKPQAIEAGMRALEAYYEALGVAVRPQPHRICGCFETRFEPRHWGAAVPPRVSVILPSRDRPGLVRQAVAAVLEHGGYAPVEIIIVDHASRLDETARLLATLRERHSIRTLRVDGEFNFSRLINLGAAASTGDLLLLLNDDIQASEESKQWLQVMIGQLLEPGVGVVGARLRYPDGRLQHAGIYAGMVSGVAHRYKHLPRDTPSYHGRAELAQTVFAVTGACLLIRRSHFEDVGGLDEEAFPVTYNDVDLCLRVRERFGARTVYVPAATLIHAESASRGRDETDPAKLIRQRKELERLCERWPSVARLDPAHNPNLGDDAARLDLRWPPAWPDALRGLLV